MFREGARQSMFVDGFVSDIFDSFFGEVFFGEISERTMGVFRSVLIFPWFVCLVVLFVEDAFELVLT